MIIKATFVRIKYRKLLAISLALALSSNCLGLGALAAATSKTKAKKAADDSGPTDTILLPLTPKIDANGLSEDEQVAPTPSDKEVQAAKSTTGGDDHTQVLESREPVVDQQLPMGFDKPKPEDLDASTVLEAGATEDDMKLAEMNEPINEDSTLKGVIQIVADDTEYDEDKNTFLGTGNAVAIIGGQDSKLEADSILYDQTNEMIDARGNVKIIRKKEVTTGSAFKFKVTSDEYLITNPDTSVDGTQIIARTAYGSHTGMMFKNGDMTLAKPFHIGKNVMFGPLSAGQDIIDRVIHPDAFVEDKPKVLSSRPAR